MRPVLAAMAIAALAGCVGRGATPCDGVGQRTSVITAKEYAPCAAAMMAALDALEPQVRAFVQGDASIRPKALETSGRLQRLLTRIGFERDEWSPGRRVERWPDSRLREFNSEVFLAAFAYHTALEVGEHVPASYNEEYLDKASMCHDAARELYADLW